MLTHAHATLFIAVNAEIFVNFWAPRASHITHRVTRNFSSANPKISSVHLQPSSQSIHQVVCLVGDPAAIFTGPSMASGLPKMGHMPTHPRDTIKVGSIVFFAPQATCNVRSIVSFAPWATFNVGFIVSFAPWATCNVRFNVSFAPRVTLDVDAIVSFAPRATYIVGSIVSSTPRVTFNVVYIFSFAPGATCDVDDIISFAPRATFMLGLLSHWLPEIFALLGPSSPFLHELLFVGLTNWLFWIFFWIPLCKY